VSPDTKTRTRYETPGLFIGFDAQLGGLRRVPRDRSELLTQTSSESDVEAVKAENRARTAI